MEIQTMDYRVTQIDAKEGGQMLDCKVSRDEETGLPRVEMIFSLNPIDTSSTPATEMLEDSVIAAACSVPKVESSTNQLDHDVTQLRSHLQDYRHMVIVFKRVLHWERAYDPAMLIAILTLMFLLMRYFELSTLTTCSILGFTVHLADLLLPMFCSLTGHWTRDQDEEFTLVCKSLSDTKQYICNAWSELTSLKRERPKLFLFVATITLLLGAEVGCVIHTSLLLYFLSLGIVLTPGIRNKTSSKGRHRICIK